MRSMLRGLAMTTILVSPLVVADFEAGVEAYAQKNYELAYQEWAPVAAAGNASAQFSLGVMYSQGLGVEADHALAAQWFGRAAEQGDVAAQFTLGLIFSQGIGVPIDTAQAFRWYHKAALQEDADAQLALGLMYARGSGVEQDVVRAVHWFRRAAIQGRSAAQAALGLMYETGRGIAQHDICAYAWFSLAAAAGSTPAQAKRDALRAKMSNAQLAQGQAFASSVARAQDCADDETQASRSLVAQVQRSLAELGYLSESTAEPGVANAETTLAVKAFQSGLGLKPTGRISEELLMLIRTRR